MLLYNTLTRKKEPFTPKNPGKASMYACGITAYDYCHIGHARSAIVFDILSRYLRHTGLDITFVRNFTDVDDKIIARANKEGISSEEVAAKYIAAFHEDMDALGVVRADVEPKATEHIDGMIAICQKLIEQGHAYATPSGDVYFRVRSFDQYGKLSGRSIDDLLSGARIAPGEEKEDPLDFALWKAAKPGEPYWESPYGKGRPGWHIECSAMSEKYLDLPFDIHGGGQDLVFPHHENEIAQTEAAFDEPFCRFWVHNGFVQIDSEKMSKSLGNFKTIRDILESYLPEVLRFFLIGRHYRSPIDFTFDAMEDAEKNARRVYETLALIHEALGRSKWSDAKLPPEFAKELEDLEKAWDSAMNDDLNTAAALGYMNNAIRLMNRLMEDKNMAKSQDSRQLYERFLEDFSRWGAIMGVFISAPQDFLADLKTCRAKRANIDVDMIEKLMAERLEARQAKDFVRSDELRDAINGMGVSVRDTPSGAAWDIA